MRITQVEPIVLRLPKVTEACDGTQDDLLIRIETDEGLYGWGEVDTSPEVGRAVIEAPTSHAIARGLREILLGQDPFDIEQLWEQMYRKTIYFGRQAVVIHTMSGVDMALWDILGKAAGKPVHKLLGGSYRDKARAYASVLMPETPAEAEKMARGFIEQGFTAMKFAWGPLGQDEGRDVELVAAARAGAGEADLMLDIGQAYRVKQAIRMAGRFEKYRLRIDIAAGEAESGRRAFRKLIEECGIDVVQPDISRAGGLTETRKIGVIAHDANIDLVPHAFKTGILLAACLHLIAALPNTELLEYTMADSPIRKLLLAQPFSAVNGYVRVPDKPGLGIEVNPDVVAQYRVT